MAKFNSVYYDHVLLKPSEQIGLHHWNSWEISYVISGEGRRILGDTEESFRDGEVVLVVPEMPHQWIFAPDKTDRNGNIENITVAFQPDLLRNLADTLPEFRPLADWFEKLDTSIKLKKTECGKIANILYRMDNESAAGRIASLLQILISIRRDRNFTVAGRFAKPSSAEDRVKKVKTYITCNYKRDISIDQLAQYVGMNRSSLCTMFKRCTGKTIVEHILDIRIEIAKYLLASTRESVSSCCYDSGFNDVPYFTRTFRQRVGLSPSEYRAQATR